MYASRQNTAKVSIHDKALYNPVERFIWPLPTIGLLKMPSTLLSSQSNIYAIEKSYEDQTEQNRRNHTSRGLSHYLKKKAGQVTRSRIFVEVRVGAFFSSPFDWKTPFVTPKYFYDLPSGDILQFLSRRREFRFRVVHHWPPLDPWPSNNAVD